MPVFAVYVRKKKRLATLYKDMKKGNVKAAKAVSFFPIFLAELSVYCLLAAMFVFLLAWK